MKITKAEFITSAVGPGQYPVLNQPEIAMVGRSNVGKSSLINKIVNRRGLARTSSQPGKTQTLNFYHINESWYFVDLPGYGYAKVSKSAQTVWGNFINEYLEKRRELVGIIQLVDIRHPPSAEDVKMQSWIAHSGLSSLVVATKADKISRGQLHKHRQIIRTGLGMPAHKTLITFSAETGTGLEELGDWIGQIVNTENITQGSEEI